MSNSLSATLLLEKGLALHAEQRFSDAFSVYLSCTREYPGNADGWHLAGAALLDSGDAAASLRYLDKAIEISGSTADFHQTRARALQMAGRFTEALKSVRQALSLSQSGSRLEALLLQGGIFCDLRDFERAEESFLEVLEFDQSCAAARNGLGEVWVGLGRYERAISEYDSLIREFGPDPRMLSNRGTALVEAGFQQQALADFDRALAYGSSPDLLANKASALIDLGRFDEALSCVEMSLQGAPRHPEATFVKALLLLRQGLSTKALELYESRLSRLSRRDPVLVTSKPRWSTFRPRERVFVWKEQGIGDQILFLSCLPALCANAKSVILEVDRKLGKLVAMSFPQVRVVTDRLDVDECEFDCQIAMGSLLLALLRANPQGATEVRQPIFFVDSKKVAKAREQFAVTGKPLIGICWRSFGRQGKKKSVELEDVFTAFAGVDARFVSLQYGPVGSEVDLALAQHPRIDFHWDDSANDEDLENHASLVAACDVVLMVTSASAHLAGALGVPGVVISHGGRAQLWFWNHLKEGRSAWYPSLCVVNSLDQAPHLLGQLAPPR